MSYHPKMASAATLGVASFNGNDFSYGGGTLQLKTGPVGFVKLSEYHITGAISGYTVTGIGSAYKVYLISYSNMAASGTNLPFLGLRFSINGGSSFLPAPNWVSMTSSSSSASSSNITMSGDSLLSRNGLLYFFDPGSTTSNVKICHLETGYQNSGGISSFYTVGVSTSAVVNAVNIYSGSSLTAGSFVLYGLYQNPSLMI